MIKIINKKGEGIMQYSIAWIFVALFIVAIIGFAIGFANDNNSPVNIADDPELIDTYEQVTGNLSNFQPNTVAFLNSTLSSSISPSAASGTTTTAGQYSIGLTDLINVAKNTISIGYKEIFGENNSFAIFLTTFLSVIAFIFGYYIFKAWIGRTPD